jgi:hypothetical protein
MMTNQTKHINTNANQKYKTIKHETLVKNNNNNMHTSTECESSEQPTHAAVRERPRAAA